MTATDQASYVLLENEIDPKEIGDCATRAVTMAIGGPADALVYLKKKWVPAELEQPDDSYYKARGHKRGEPLCRRLLLWHHFRFWLKHSWLLTARASNWAIRELLKNEPDVGMGDTKILPMPKINLFDLYQKHRDRPLWDGMTGSLASLLRQVESKYRTNRLATAFFHRASAPSFKMSMPYLVPASTWCPAEREDKAELDKEWLVAFPMGPYRWIVRLRRDAKSVKYNQLWEQIRKGELTRRAVQVYGVPVEGNDNKNGMTIRLPGGFRKQDFRVMFKAVTSVPVKVREKTTVAAMIRTDDASLLVVELQGRGQPWTINGDHLKARIVAHRNWLQRINEDKKFERRSRSKTKNRQMKETVEIRCRKHSRYIKTQIGQICSSLTQYLLRNGVSVVSYDDSATGFLPSFPYFQFESQLACDLEIAGIELASRRRPAAAENDGIEDNPAGDAAGAEENAGRS